MSSITDLTAKTGSIKADVEGKLSKIDNSALEAARKRAGETMLRQADIQLNFLEKKLGMVNGMAEEIAGKFNTAFNNFTGDVSETLGGFIDQLDALQESCKINIVPPMNECIDEINNAFTSCSCTIFGEIDDSDLLERMSENIVTEDTSELPMLDIGLRLNKLEALLKKLSIAKLIESTRCMFHCVAGMTGVDVTSRLERLERLTQESNLGPDGTYNREKFLKDMATACGLPKEMQAGISITSDCIGMVENDIKEKIAAFADTKKVALKANFNIGKWKNPPIDKDLF